MSFRALDACFAVTQHRDRPAGDLVCLARLTADGWRGDTGRLDLLVRATEPPPAATRSWREQTLAIPDAAVQRLVGRLAKLLAAGGSAGLRFEPTSVSACAGLAVLARLDAATLALHAIPLDTPSGPGSGAYRELLAAVADLAPPLVHLLAIDGEACGGGTPVGKAETVVDALGTSDPRVLRSPHATLFPYVPPPALLPVVAVWKREADYLADRLDFVVRLGRPAGGIEADFLISQAFSLADRHYLVLLCSDDLAEPPDCQLILVGVPGPQAVYLLDVEEFREAETCWRRLDPAPDRGLGLLRSIFGVVPFRAGDR